MKASHAIESICFQIAKLDAEKQKSFIDSLRGTLSDEEIKALEIGIAYFRMIIHEDLREGMKAVLAQQLYREFTEGLEKANSAT